MVWEGISLKGTTDIHAAGNGLLSSVMYRDKPIFDIARPLVESSVPYGALGSLTSSGPSVEVHP